MFQHFNYFAQFFNQMEHSCTLSDSICLIKVNSSLNQFIHRLKLDRNNWRLLSLPEKERLLGYQWMDSGSTISKCFEELTKNGG